MNTRIEFPPELLTRDLVAFLISGSITEVDELRAKGELIAVGKGKRLKFRLEDVRRYIANLPERDS